MLSKPIVCYLWVMRCFAFDYMWATIMAKGILTSSPSNNKRPHILMIVVDDLGSHDLGMHGSEILTPASDALANEGIYLDNYYVLPSCSASRASLLSGRYPLHTGVYTWIPERSTAGLPLDEETLAQVLKRANYTTHAVGKWHIGHSTWNQTPTFRGFETFFGFKMEGEDYFTHMDGKATDLRWESRENCGEGCSEVVDERGNYSTHVFTRRAIDVLDNYTKGQQDKPLFLYLAYQAVHGPDEVPQYYKDMYMGKNWTDLRKTYAGMLTAADEGIANVTKALKETGLWNDTLIIFTTDNGGPTATCGIQGSSNYPRRGGKCSVWEGGTTGDGFLSGPALTTIAGMVGNRRMGDIFHIVDWLPTLAELVGAKPEGKPLDGVSQLSGLKGPINHPPARQEVFVGYAQAEYGLWYGPSLRHGQWKIIQGNSGGRAWLWQKPGGGTTEPMQGGIQNTTYLLYDLSMNREESQNVADQHPEIVNWLRGRLQFYSQTFVPPQANNDHSCPLTGFENSSIGPAWYAEQNSFSNTPRNLRTHNSFFFFFSSLTCGLCSFERFPWCNKVVVYT